MISPAALIVPLLTVGFVQALGPADDPRTIDEAERLVPRSPDRLQTFSPVPPETSTPVRPGLTGGQDWTAMLEPAWPGALESPLLPERTFLNKARGTVLRGPNGTRIFVPAPTETNPMPRAMLLLPCTVLERFDTYSLADSDRPGVLLSGQVFLYNDRNYVLPTLMQITVRDSTNTPPPRSADAVATTGAAPIGDQAGAVNTTAAQDRAADPLADNPDVAALMSQLERHNPISRPVSKPQPEAPAATEETGSEFATPTPIKDGGYVAARRGRVIRLPEGVWAFVADTDEPSAGRSWILLPCRTLEALERRAFYTGDAVAGLISGRVYHYDGQDYLLPTLYQTEHRNGIDPLQ